MLNGNTALIAHIGYPTSSFKAPMIYNPYFESIGLNAAVIPMGVRGEDFDVSFNAIFRMSNIHGALITMPHKVTVLDMLDDVSVSVKISGACNAVLRKPDGSLIGDMFDGDGFVQGVLRKGQKVAGARILVVGAGGVGSAIAASFAAAGAGHIGIYDISMSSMEELATRLVQHYSNTTVEVGSNDPDGYNIIVNATPLGMKAGDAMPVDVARIAPDSFVGEVVMSSETTPFLAAAKARGCPTQIGLDMLYEQIPAYLAFFGFPVTTPHNLRALARISY
ncbi:MAG: shikimate dehydrogenase family protein [Beijerinckiaceae bacterium]